MAQDPLSRVLALVSDRLRVLPPAAQRPKGIGAGIVIRRFREGFTSLEDFRSEALALGYLPDEIDRMGYQAQLEYELDYAMDLLALYADAFAKGRVTTEDLDRLLANLGMVPERREAFITRQVVKRTPKLKPPKEEPAPVLSVAQLSRAYRLGDIDDAGFLREVLDRGYSQRDAMILLGQAREEKFPPPAELNLAQLRLAFQRGDITEAQYRAVLAERRFSLANIELVILQSRAAPPPPPPQLSLTQLRDAFRLGDITQGQLTELILAKGFPEREAELLVRQFRPLPPPPPPALSVPQLMTAFGRGIITERDVVKELEERKYSLEDLNVLRQLATAPPPKPSPQRIRQLSEAQLRAMFAADIITEAEYLDGLEALGLSAQDATRLLELELTRKVAREPEAIA